MGIIEHNNNIIIVIPARLESARMPRKMLAADTGKPVIQHTVDAAIASNYPCCVATDSKEIANVVKGVPVYMTSKSHQSGTDRLVEVAKKYFQSVGIFINLQGDHPEIPTIAIEKLVKTLIDYPNIGCATLAAPILRQEEIYCPDRVKVVIGYHKQAVYFSRQPLPSSGTEFGHIYYQHIGIYAYRRQTLLNFGEWSPTALEKVERLEQMRLLEHGEYIAVEVLNEPIPSIDTPEDYRAFCQRAKKF